MTETLRHKEAFECYYAAGEERSLLALARDIGVSEKTVKHWSVVFGWQERIQRRDDANGKRLEKITDETIVEVKARYRKLIAASIGAFVKQLKAGTVQVTQVSDLEKLIKLDLLLLGENTEKTTVNHDFSTLLGLKGLSDDDLRARLADYGRKLSS